jgi:hypothetical protein
MLDATALTLVPARKPYLPASLQRLSLGTINRDGRTEYFLPGSIGLPPALREEIARELDARRQEIDPAGERNLKGRAFLFGKVLLGYPSAHGALSSQARSEIYREAVDDCPAWAIAGAMRNWACGQCGDHYDYQFAPSPAVLRIWSRKEMAPYLEAITRLETLLTAKPLEEIMPLPDFRRPPPDLKDVVASWRRPDAGGHARRVLADLAARMAARQQ